VLLHEWHERLREQVRDLEAARGRVGPPAITAGEMRVLEQLPTHRSLAAIGAELFVSRNTVKTHAVSIYRKLGVTSREEAVETARGRGLIP
jgi:LuxR family maltose regulon positive regulatory protein